MFLFNPLTPINQISWETLWNLIVIQTWMWWSQLNRRGPDQCWKFNEDAPDLCVCKWWAVYLRGLYLLFDFNLAPHCFKEVIWGELQPYFLGIYMNQIRSITIFSVKQEDSQLCSFHCPRTQENSQEFLKGSSLVLREHTLIVKA